MKNLFRYIIYYFYLIMLPIGSFSQTFNWRSIIHGGGYFETCQDQFGNIYCGGVSQTLNPVINNQPQTGFPLIPSGLLVKYNVNQTVQWIKVLSNSGENYIHSIAYSVYSGIWICGTFQDSITLGANKYYSPGVQSLFVAKLDPGNSNILWSTAGISTVDITNPSLTITPQQDVILAGQFNGTVQLLNQTFISQGARDIFCLKISRYGLFHWKTEITSGADEILSAKIHSDQAGNIYLAGSTFSSSVSIGGIPFTPSLPIQAPAFIAKLNAGGQALWVAFASLSGSFVGNANGSFSDITTDSQNNVYFSDTHSPNASYGNIYFAPTPTSNGIHAGLGKIDSTGQYCWVQQYFDPAPQIGSASTGLTIAYSQDGKLYWGGSFYNQLQVGNTLLQNYNQFTNGFIVQLDTAGLEKWAIQATGPGASVLLDIVPIGNDQVNCLLSHQGSIQLSGLSCPGYHASGNGILTTLKMKTNLASGKVFLDANGNGLSETGEPFLSGRWVYATQNNLMSQTDLQGKYEIWLPTGIETLTSQPPNTNYYISTPQPMTVNFPGMNLSDSSLHIGIAPNGSIQDLEIFLTRKLPITPNQMSIPFQMDYFNKGTTAVSGQIQLVKDSKLNFVSSQPIQSQTIGDTVLWNLGNLAPLTGGSITFDLTLAQSGQPGEPFVCTANLLPTSGDNTPSDNMDNDTTFLDEPFIGNNKIVSKNSLTQTDLIEPTELFYTIYFQNKTDSTISDILIIDTISNLLNLTSFSFISASHSPLMITQANREIKFHFPNILLPDSISNPSGSVGFVKYRIKPNQNIPSGNTIYNVAGIYMDYIEPVQTNLAYTYISFPLSATEPNIENMITIYPNPIQNGIFKIRLNDLIKPSMLEIYSSQGQMVHSMKLNSESEEREIDVNGLELPQGIYFGRLSGNNSNYNFRMMVIKN